MNETAQTPLARAKLREFGRHTPPICRKILLSMLRHINPHLASCVPIFRFSQSYGLFLCAAIVDRQSRHAPAATLAPRRLSNVLRWNRSACQGGFAQPRFI